MILSKGEIVYHGPNSEAVDYFAALGYECPADSNPAEHFLDLVQPGMKMSRKEKNRLGGEKTSLDVENGQSLVESAKDDRIAFLVQHWKSRTHQTNTRDQNEGEGGIHPVATPHHHSKASAFFSMMKKENHEGFYSQHHVRLPPELPLDDPLSLLPVLLL